MGIETWGFPSLHELENPASGPRVPLTTLIFQEVIRNRLGRQHYGGGVSEHLAIIQCFLLLLSKSHISLSSGASLELFLTLSLLTMASACHLAVAAISTLLAACCY
jgi:hypothetical protein